jgi:hypothetical protein
LVHSAQSPPPLGDGKLSVLDIFLGQSTTM